jgi:hypothetical protein
MSEEKICPIIAWRSSGEMQECLKEKCALWVIIHGHDDEIISQYCGLIRD